MANSKISALTSATTPLAGTETLPIVQGGVTVKTTAADITGGGGYAGSFTSLAYTTTLTGGTGIVAIGTNQFYKSAAGNIGLGTSSPAEKLQINGGGLLIAGTATTNNYSGLVLDYNSGTGEARVSAGGVSGASSFLTFTTANGGVEAEKMRVAAAGNVTISTGNVVQGTAAKGFDFSANTPLAGKTSTILNWYEEGTWTPNQGAGLTLVGAFSSTGKYTRIGRNVTVSGTVTGATSVAVTAAGVVTSNLPFTIGTAGHGNATNAAITASAAVICNTGTTLTSADAIAATGTITFSATYFA